MPKITQPAKRGRGRPKTFDRTQAIDVAMKMFWDRGFEGTSLDDLISAMGISCSSFYNAFESKEKLYYEASQAYLDSANDWFLDELNAPGKNTRASVEGVLSAFVKQYTAEDGPCGCMIALAATHLAPELHSVREMMSGRRKLSQSIFAARISRGIREGDVPVGTKVDALATYYSAVSQGMAVQARDGANRKQLREIVSLAMQAWPAITATAK